jgi:hypothetical protein
LLKIFRKPTINLLDQLSQLAYSSHLIFYIYRKWHGKFLPAQLYHDIQATIQDAFVVTRKVREKCESSQLFLYQLGTDQLEALFGIVRTLTHARNCDYLELIDRLKIAFQIFQVYVNHPDWKRVSRICSYTNDYSSADSWIGNLTAGIKLNLIVSFL